MLTIVLAVELVVAIVGGDDDGVTDVAAKGGEDLPAKLLQYRNELQGGTVVNTQCCSSNGVFTLMKVECS